MAPKPDASFLGAGGKKAKKGEISAPPKDPREVRALKRGGQRGSEKASWKKRAGGLAILVAICGVGFVNFLVLVYDFVSGDGVTVVDVRDTVKLKSILFSGDPWLVYCVTNKTQNERMPKVLEDGAKALKSSQGVSVASLHCWEPTESGRSVVQRFKLKAAAPPLTFLVANGNKPKPVNFVGVGKYEDLEKKIAKGLKITISKIDTLKKWPSLCTSRRTCVIVGHKNNAQRDTALNLVKPLLESNRRVKFVTLDTAFWQLKLDEALLKTRPSSSDKQRGADVVCLARDESGKKQNATYSAAFLPQLTSRAATSFVKACEARSEELVPIAGAPKLTARPSKPRKVTPPTPRPPPPRRQPPPPPPPKDRANVDRVGSRAKMEQQAEEEALFEAVEEDEEEEEGEESGGAESDGDDTEEGDEDETADADEIEL